MIKLASVPVTKTIVMCDEIDIDRDRLKIVFDDGAMAYFKPQRHFSRYWFVLDIKLTDLALVDEILLPQDHGLDDDENDKQFDIFSVITIEQYRQLRCASVPGDENFSEVGDELFVWRGWLPDRGSTGGTAREGHVIAEITSITLDS